MQENEKQAATANTPQAGATGTAKPLHEKITEAINKDDDLLAKILKALSNPLVLIIGILALLYWSKQQQNSFLPDNKNENPETKLTKLKKKNKQLKKQIRLQSQATNGRTQRAASIIN